MFSDLLHTYYQSKTHPSGALIKIICRLLLYFFTFSLLNNYTIAQQPTLEWVARIPGPSNDLYGPFFTVDKNGNSYITGTHVVNDSINILCAKYNTAGVQQWSILYKYPGIAYFAPAGIAIDSSGNAYVIAECGPSSLPPWSGLIIKFNGINGTQLWAKKYDGNFGTSTFDDIKIDALNNIYVAGSSDSSHLLIRYTTAGDTTWVRKYHPTACGEFPKACTIDDSLNIIFTGFRRHYYVTGFYDSLLVVKYSPSGLMRWESTYGYNLFFNVGTKITNDQNGNLYIGGETTISAYAVYLTLKYNRNGVQQWAKIYDAPGNGDNNLNGIAVDKIYNVLFVTGGATTNGIQVATTIKYNVMTGDSIWVKKDSGSYSRANNSSIIVDSSGFIYTTGGTYNLGLFPFDIITRKYTEQGNAVWTMTYNGPFNGIDYGLDVALDIFRNVYILATSESNTGIRDYIILKYSQLLRIKPISNKIPKTFNIGQNFPNPFNPVTKIKFSIPKLSNVNITVFDILGRVADVPVNEQLNSGIYEISINAANYSSGTYFYRMSADGNIIDTKKMIIIK